MSRWKATTVAILIASAPFTVNSDAMAAPEDGTWLMPAIPAPLPAPRMGHAVVYDPVRHRMIMFGGEGGQDFNDVWILTLSGSPEWQRLVTSGTPPLTRSGHVMIYDPMRDRVVVVGGSHQVPPPVYRQTLYDVWELTLSDVPTWTELNAAGSLPSGYRAYKAAYDVDGDRMIVHGGEPGPTGQTRQLPFASTLGWSQLPDGPAVAGHALVADPTRHRMIEYGGYCGISCFTSATWALDLAGTPRWTVLAPSGGPPAGRWEPSAVNDTHRDRMLVFGGRVGPNQYSNEVWALSLSGAPTWTLLAPSGTPPVGRWHADAVYDPLADRMVIFGGAGYGFFSNETWFLTFTGALSVSDASAGLAIRSAGWDWSAHHFALTFSIPVPGSVHIDVSDVSGRSVASETRDGLSAGMHQATLAVHGPLHSGVFFIRIRQASRQVAKQVVILK